MVEEDKNGSAKSAELDCKINGVLVETTWAFDGDGTIIETAIVGPQDGIILFFLGGD